MFKPIYFAAAGLFLVAAALPTVFEYFRKPVPNATVRLPGSSVDLVGTLSKDSRGYLLVQADGKQVSFKQFDYISVPVEPPK